MPPVSRHFPARLSSAILLYAVVVMAVARAGPQPFEASYQLLLNNIPVGTQTLTLVYLPDQDLYRFETRLMPNRLARWFHDESRTEFSEFYWRKGLLSQHYRLERHSGEATQPADLRFDWSQQRVINDVAGERWTMPIPPGTLDKLNVQLALMLDLAAGKRQLRYDIADGGKLKQFRFEVVGEEPVEAAGKTYQTLRIQRIRKDQDRTTFLWCAPQLGYLPVRIEQTEQESGEHYVSRLVRYASNQAERDSNLTGD